MLLTRRHFCGSAVAAALVSGTSPLRATTVSTPLASNGMQHDLALLEAIYARLHPGLTRYQSREAFAARVAGARKWASRPRSQGEFYLALARLTAAVRCGHTHANPANQKNAIQQQLLGREDRLPFCTRWLKGRLYVADPLASSVTRGSGILAIDGVPARRMLADMLPLTRADGHNDGKRVAQLELHRGDRFAAFDLLRRLLYGSGRTSADLDLRTPDGKLARVTVPLRPEGKRGVPAAMDPQFGWRFAIGSDGIGLLSMPDWSLYNSKWDWRAFLNGVADELISARARGLVIDLRENEGGIDCGDVLLARLIDQPIQEDAVRRLTTFRSTPPEWRSLLDTWDRSFHQLGEKGTPALDRPGYFDIGSTRPRRVAPTGSRYSGKVVILVSAICSSATFGFARFVRSARVATIVGTPTGGNLRGINGGAYFFVRLPETGFEVDLPLIGYFPTRPQPDAGLVPDVVVETAAADLAVGRDPQMQAARKLVLASR